MAGIFMCRKPHSWNQYARETVSFDKISVQILKVSSSTYYQTCSLPLIIFDEYHLIQLAKPETWDSSPTASFSSFPTASFSTLNCPSNLVGWILLPNINQIFLIFSFLTPFILVWLFKIYYLYLQNNSYKTVMGIYGIT